MYITFCFNACSTINLFSFFQHLWRIFLVLEKILLLIIFLQQTKGSCLVIPCRQLPFIGFWPVVLWPQYSDGNKKHHEITVCLTIFCNIGSIFLYNLYPRPTHSVNRKYPIGFLIQSVEEEKEESCLFKQNKTKQNKTEAYSVGPSKVFYNKDLEKKRIEIAGTGPEFRI